LALLLWDVAYQSSKPLCWPFSVSVRWFNALNHRTDTLNGQHRGPGPVLSRELRAQIEGIRVAYPRWQRIVAEIGRCQEWGPLAAEPPCLLLVGPTGAGKSTLVGSYAWNYPPVLTETGTTYPV